MGNNMESFLHPESLEQILNHSKTAPVLVFKHSLTCPISTGAYSRIIEGIEGVLVKHPVYIVIVQKDRDLSNSLAEALGVEHESPQLILIKDRQAVYDTSHGGILVEDIP